MEMLRYLDVAGTGSYHAALVQVSKSVRLRPHEHADFHELVYVLHGQGWQQVGERRQQLRRGDLVLVRPRDVHTFGVGHGAELRFVNVAFPSERWRAFVDYAGIGAAAAWERAPLPVLVHDDRELSAAPMNDALAAYHDHGDVLDLIRLWTATIPLLAAAADASDPRPVWLVRACTAMRTEENLRAGLPRLLTMAAVSHGHLARSMATHYGMTPVEFVNEARLVHAAALLATTTEPVGKIAARSGFSSQSYFARRFHDKYRQSPREYRKHMRRVVVP